MQGVVKHENSDPNILGQERHTNPWGQKTEAEKCHFGQNIYSLFVFS